MRGTRTATGGVSTVQNEDSVMEQEQVARGGGQEAEATRQLGSTVGRGGTCGTRRHISYLMFQSFKVQTNTCHGPRIMSSTCYGGCRLNRSFLTFLEQTACHGHTVHVTRDKE